MLTFTLNGVEYTVDINKLSLREAFELKDRTGLSITEYTSGVLTMSDPYALGFLVYLAKRRAGEAVDWDELDFDLIELAGELLSARTEEPAEAAEDTPAESE